MLSLAAKGGLISTPAETNSGHPEAAEQEGSSGSSVDLTEGAPVRPSDSASSRLGQCMPEYQASSTVDEGMQRSEPL